MEEYTVRVISREKALNYLTIKNYEEDGLTWHGKSFMDKVSYSKLELCGETISVTPFENDDIFIGAYRGFFLQHWLIDSIL